MIRDPVYGSRPLSGLGEVTSYAYAINNAGVIAGTLIAGDDSRAVIWIDDQPPLVLGTPGAFWSEANGINNLNHVAGTSIRGLREQAYVWPAESGMVALPVSEYTESPYAYAISGLRWIVGSVRGETPAGSRSQIAVRGPVPEPASLLVLAFGLAGAALSRTRSRSRLCS